MRNIQESGGKEVKVVRTCNEEKRNMWARVTVMDVQGRREGRQRYSDLIKDIKAYQHHKNMGKDAEEEEGIHNV